ncbi:hypothetical protein JKP88DRAFT_285615 [Tribonema minus]|uniref:Uncharacterized protein n=1 Tax=Tribonema minus TaxID=303371 RepID=A0A835ZAP0_9STRA|nr:hypothetical protein JKP88DRAFT_285615 [Tribonema minus]
MPPKSQTPTAPPAAAPATPAGSSYDGVEAELSIVAQAIIKVEGQIDAVEIKVNDVEKVLQEEGKRNPEQPVYLSMNVQELKEHLKALRREKEALMKKEEQLRKEKEQLREEKAKLMDRQAMPSPDVPGELLIELLGPPPPETDESFDW